MGYLFVLLTTLSAALASFFLKQASPMMAKGLIHLLRSLHLWIGGALYVVAALFNILALRLLDYTVVVPLGAFTYVWTMILSRVLLKEPIGRRKIIALGLILLGAALVTLG